MIIANIYLFIIATCLALLEIQIEGNAGWAKNLPTWRPVNSWYAKFYSKIRGGKEFTGYHLIINIFLLIILGVPYVFNLPLTLENILKTFSYYLILLTLWDFLWFVLNPHYPLKLFKKEHIWWHTQWFWKIPIDYYMGILLSLLLVIPLIIQQQSSNLLYWWLMNLNLFAIQTILLIIFTLYVLKIDNWKINETNKK